MGPIFIGLKLRIEGTAHRDRVLVDDDGIACDVHEECASVSEIGAMGPILRRKKLRTIRTANDHCLIGNDDRIRFPIPGYVRKKSASLAEERTMCPVFVR